MFVIGHTLVSLDILQEEFICNLEQCRGACCVEGDSGAPLLPEELEEIQKILPQVKPLMTGEGLHLLDNKSFYEKDTDGELVTQCIDGRACIFSYQDRGTYRCAIEKAGTAFPKPLSCHLYPIRLSQVGEYTALNYHRWDICSAACSLGHTQKMPLYRFLKQPLIRAFGAEWYASLEAVAAEWARQNS